MTKLNSVFLVPLIFVALLFSSLAWAVDESYCGDSIHIYPEEQSSAYQLDMAQMVINYYISETLFYTEDAISAEKKKELYPLPFAFINSYDKSKLFNLSDLYLMQIKSVNELICVKDKYINTHDLTEDSLEHFAKVSAYYLNVKKMALESYSRINEAMKKYSSGLLYLYPEELADTIPDSVFSLTDVYDVYKGMIGLLSNALVSADGKEMQNAHVLGHFVFHLVTITDWLGGSDVEELELLSVYKLVEHALEVNCPSYNKE